jgi:hypothetical protein
VPTDFRVPGDQGQVDRGFEIVELQLDVLEPGGDIRRDLVAEVANAQCAAHEHAQEGAYEEDEHKHGHRLISFSGELTGFFPSLPEPPGAGYRAGCS